MNVLLASLSSVRIPNPLNLDHYQKTRFLQVLSMVTIGAFFLSCIDLGGLSVGFLIASYFFACVAILSTLLFDRDEKQLFWMVIISLILIFGSLVTLLKSQLSLSFLTIAINIAVYRTLKESQIEMQALSRLMLFMLITIASIDLLGISRAAIIIKNSENHISILCSLVLMTTLIAKCRLPWPYLLTFVYLLVSSGGRANLGFAAALVLIMLFQQALETGRVKLLIIGLMIILIVSIYYFQYYYPTLLANIDQLDYLKDTRFDILSAVYQEMNFVNLIIGPDSNQYSNLQNSRLSSHNSYLSIFEAFGLLGIAGVLSLLTWIGVLFLYSPNKIIPLFVILIMGRAFIDNFLFTYGPVFGGLLMYLLWKSSTKSSKTDRDRYSL